MTGFPGRPDHPDLWLISQAVLDLDAMADAGQNAPEIAGRHIDLASAVYMARQRALRAMASVQERPIEVVLAGAWLDGLIAGMIVQHLKTTFDSDLQDPGTQEKRS
jgi:hypothetical protein